MHETWRDPSWITQTQRMLDSYQQLLGEELIARGDSAIDDARNLFHADRIVVAHGTQDDPILCYGNQAALELWEMDVATLTSTPSRMTAEPVHRDERARLLERATRDGYVDDYQGIRISSTGKRFQIERAVVWNLFDEQNYYAGQAATFTAWHYLEK